MAGRLGRQQAQALFLLRRLAGDVPDPLAVGRGWGAAIWRRWPSAGKGWWTGGFQFPPGAAMREDRIATSRDVAIAIGTSADLCFVS